MLICSNSLILMSDCERFAQVAHDKRGPWANRSGCSWQKSDCERFAQVAHDKRATGSNYAFSLAKYSFTIYYFAHKNKRIARKANHWKNRYANSQDCRKPGLYFVTVSNCSDNSVMWRSVRCHCVWFLILTLLISEKKLKYAKKKKNNPPRFESRSATKVAGKNVPEHKQILASHCEYGLARN